MDENGLSLALSQTLKTGFVATRPNCNKPTSTTTLFAMTFLAHLHYKGILFERKNCMILSMVCPKEEKEI